jgi:hypothetical protein
VSTNPMQRIADLEAQVASLTSTNETLRANGNGNGHVDVEKLIKQGFDRFGQDYTGKLAGLIQPFIENTVRRCKETEEKQTALEEKFRSHAEAVGKSADALATSFRKLHKEAENDWNAHRAQMQQDFVRVDGFVSWVEAETAKSWQENVKATTNCNLAVRACNDLLQKLDKPIEESIEHLNRIKAHGDTIILSAAEDLRNTYQRLREPVLKRVTILIIATIFIYLGIGTLVFWGNRHLINTNWRELTEHSDQQKTELKELIDKTIDEAKESQLDREIKVKMWDAMLNTLTPQQRHDAIEKFRWQVNEAERKRLGDQMGASHDQMEGKRK